MSPFPAPQTLDNKVEPMTYSVAVSGASGYAGGEILRLLAGHPDIEIRTVTAHSNAGQPLVHIFLDSPTGQAMDTGVAFLRIVAPFYFIVSAKLVSDGVLRGAGLMKKFMIATFTDLVLRVALAEVLSRTALGTTGIWISWPIGWTIAAALSIVFYATVRWEKVYTAA